MVWLVIGGVSITVGGVLSVIAFVAHSAPALCFAAVLIGIALAHIDFAGE